jgi:hypothetical protein
VNAIRRRLANIINSHRMMTVSRTMIAGMTMPMAGIPLEGSRLEMGLTIMLG